MLSTAADKAWAQPAAPGCNVERNHWSMDNCLIYTCTVQYELFTILLLIVWLLLASYEHYECDTAGDNTSAHTKGLTKYVQQNVSGVRQNWLCFIYFHKHMFCNCQCFHPWCYMTPYPTVWRWNWKLVFKGPLPLALPLFITSVHQECIFRRNEIKSHCFADFSFFIEVKVMQRIISDSWGGR